MSALLYTRSHLSISELTAQLTVDNVLNERSSS